MKYLQPWPTLIVGMALGVLVLPKVLRKANINVG